MNSLKKLPSLYWHSCLSSVLKPLQLMLQADLKDVTKEMTAYEDIMTLTNKQIISGYRR